jgi:hypothetical protein
MHLPYNKNSLNDAITACSGTVGIYAYNPNAKNNSYGHRLSISQTICANENEYFLLGNLRNLIIAPYIFNLIQKNYMSLQQPMLVAYKNSQDLSHSKDASSNTTVQQFLEHMLSSNDSKAARELLQEGSQYQNIQDWLLEHNFHDIHIASSPAQIHSDDHASSNFLLPLALTSIKSNPTDDQTYADYATPRAMTSFLMACLHNTHILSEQHRQLLKQSLSKEDNIYLHSSEIDQGCNSTAMMDIDDYCIFLSVMIKDAKEIGQARKSTATITSALINHFYKNN